MVLIYLVPSQSHSVEVILLVLYIAGFNPISTIGYYYRLQLLFRCFPSSGGMSAFCLILNFTALYNEGIISQLT